MVVKFLGSVVKVGPKGRFLKLTPLVIDHSRKFGGKAVFSPLLVIDQFENKGGAKYTDIN